MKLTSDGLDAQSSSAALGIGRLRRSVLICTLGWGMFMLESLLRGNARSAEITAVVTAFTAMLWTLTLHTADPHRLANLVRTNIYVSYMGMLASAVTHGYTVSPAAWLVGLLPLFAAYHLRVWDTFVCAGLSATLVILIGLLQPINPVATEFIFQGARLTFAQLLNVLLVLAFAVNASRTHEKQLEIIGQQNREIAAARDAAVEAGEIKARFLANMSHEIRTPLNGMLGLAGLLDHSRLDDQQRHWLSVIQGSGKLLVAILNDILDYSKLESGQMALESVPFELEDIVMDVVELFYSEAQRKSVELIAVISPDVAPVQSGDPLRLGQILLNLTSNGVKFTQNGQVVLRVNPAPSGLSFQVCDSGVGIPADKLDRLFRPFHQVDSSITRQFGGTGLGLAISQRLAVMMGGVIVAESQLGRGSTFRFQLPLTPVPTVSTPPNPVRVATSGFSSLEQENFRALAGRLSLQAVEESPDLVLVQGELAPGEFGGARQVLVCTPGSPHGEGILLRPLRGSQLRNLVNKLFGTDVPATPEPSELKPGLPANLRILVAEDNAVNRKVMCSILQSPGGSTEVAETGARAVELCGQNSFDLIIMDLQMPVMDGIEAIRRIRAASASRPPWIVAVTADVLPETRAAVMEMGADGFLPKPVDRTLLLQLIKELGVTRA